MMRAGFAIIELPLVIGVLAVLLGIGLLIAGQAAWGCVVAVVGLLPCAWVLLWPLIDRGARKQERN